MSKQQSVITLDPIDSKRKKNWLERLLITRWSGGRSLIKSEPYGHYMFCGPQGSSKSVSSLWYAEWIRKRYKKRKIRYWDDDAQKYIKFDEPPKVKLYSNVDVGVHVEKKDLANRILSFDPYANEVRIVLIDEIHGYFPKEGNWDKETKALFNQLIPLFSQLRKRNTYVLSTAQVYGRLHKALREQCLYMINCKTSFRGRAVNEFIRGDDIIADELGRWSGNPSYIRVHGLPKSIYDSKKVIIS